MRRSWFKAVMQRRRRLRRMARPSVLHCFTLAQLATTTNWEIKIGKLGAKGVTMYTPGYTGT